MGTRDLETARTVKLRPIEDVAETLGLAAADLEPYGSYKAKVRWGAIERSRARPDGALVLVTAMTPTPAGEGKSTTTIGLADGLRKLGTRSIAALRQPASGPSSAPRAAPPVAVARKSRRWRRSTCTSPATCT